MILTSTFNTEVRVFVRVCSSRRSDDTWMHTDDGCFEVDLAVGLYLACTIVASGTRPPRRPVSCRCSQHSKDVKSVRVQDTHTTSKSYSSVANARGVQLVQRLPSISTTKEEGDSIEYACNTCVFTKYQESCIFLCDGLSAK